MPAFNPQIIFAVAVWFYWFSQYTYVPILPTYAKDLGASYQFIGVILGAYGFTQMLLRLPLGIMSDRLNRRKALVIIGMAICFASGLGMWLFPNVYALLVFRGLSGVAASFWVIQTVLFASYYPAADVSKAMGRIASVLNFGQMTAMLAGGVAAYFYGQESAFLLSAVSGLLAFIVSFGIKENVELKREPMKLADLVELASNRHLNIVGALGVLLQVMTFGTIFGFIPLVAKSLGASFLEIGLLPTVFMLPGILASAMSGTTLLKFMDERWLLGLSFLAMTAVCFVTPFITTMTALYLTQALCGAARGVTFPLLLGLSIKEVAGHRRATAMGYYQAVYALGMFVGPLTVGKLAQMAGLDWGFWAVSAVAAAGAVTAFALLPRGSERQVGTG